MQNLLKDLTELLSKDERLSAEGKLLKNKAIEIALAMDAKLIKLLLKNEKIKKHFFTEVDGVMVFDKIKFQKFVSNKEFLPDSYTAFKNKIGLVNENGDYLSESREVVLAWPYKDCILEGGQTKEDQKRDEIFWNETLAPDEIDTLLSSKTLTNWIKYDLKGEHALKGKETIDFNNENIIIRGNNLLALRSLSHRYAGKIKLIYIDPPYNTGGGANTFSYNNSFNHSSWLTFMRNRLEIAKILLANNGVICISIDDEEYAHLKILCDEIFDRENYLGTIIVQSNPRGRTINSEFATCHEYALFYAKNKSLAIVNNQPLTEEQERDFDKNDKTGDFRYLPFRRSGGTSTPDERPNSEFSLYYSHRNKNIIAVGGERKNDPSQPYKPVSILTLDDQLNIQENNPKSFLQKYGNDIIEILPIDVYGKRRVWRWSDRKKILLSAGNNDFNVVVENDKYTVQLKDRIKEGRKPKTIWTDSKYDASANGTILLKNIFDGEKLFSYPKSLYTVLDTIQILTNSDTDDIILDFFCGSGTTAHAVLELNKADDGNRKFILCEQMEYIDNVTKERVNKVIKQNKEGSFIYCELMELNEAYIKSIKQSTTTKELLLIWNEMQKKGFISYNVNPKSINENISDFKELSLKDQKRFLIEILDKNQLYVNYSEIDDKDYNVSDIDKKLNKMFYGEV